MSNNTGYRATCTSLLAIGAIVSAILTCQFMHQLAIDAGASPLLFAAVGILLDSTKTLCPALASRLINRSMVTALLLCAFTITLSAISVSASVFAIDSGIESAQKNSREYTAYSKQIVLLEDEITSLKALAAQQQDANQITRSSETLAVVSAKATTLSKLISEQATIKPSGLLSKYGNHISIIIAVSLELLTLALHQLKNTSYTAAHSDTPSVQNPLNMHGTPANTLALAGTNNTVTPLLKTPEIFVAKTESQTLAEVKAAVISGVVKPSHRGIKSMFKIPQEQIKNILEILHNEGLLEPWNNGGYRLAQA